MRTHSQPQHHRPAVRHRHIVRRDTERHRSSRGNVKETGSGADGERSCLSENATASERKLGVTIVTRCRSDFYPSLGSDCYSSYFIRRSHRRTKMPPRSHSLQSSGLTLSETSMGSFKRRKRKSITVTVMLLIVSVLILVFGLAATTRTQNITVGGYYPGVILGFGSFLGIIGAHLIENKRQMLVASIVFISFGAVAAFCCAIVDGVFAARHIDLRPLHAGRCGFLSSDSASERDVPCHTPRSSCKLHVKSNTCYCCDLYNCGSRAEVMGGYHEYTDVRSCQDVVHLYYLLWSATILNIVALFLGIITAAVLGGFKDMMPAPASETGSEPEAIAAPVPPAAPPTTALNLYHNTAPCLPPYTAYDLQGPFLFPDSSGLSDDSQSGASHLWPTMVPPRYSPPHEHPDEKPPPYSP